MLIITFFFTVQIRVEMALHNKIVTASVFMTLVLEDLITFVNFMLHDLELY